MLRISRRASILKRPVILDLFCGAGGSALGLYRAGFDVIGVDNKPMLRYPFKFYQADALTFALDGYDAIWASPPCQAYSCALNYHRDRTRYPRLIESTRERLIATKKPYIIENVPGAPLLNPIVLCGKMFGLYVRRHRLFESNISLLSPPHPKCLHSEYLTVNGYSWRERARYRKDAWGKAMGIDWMNGKELSQAIPPAYSEFLGKQLIQYIPGETKE